MLLSFIPEGLILSARKVITLYLGVREDRTREVLAIVNFPTESAQAWDEVLKTLKARGVEEIGLVVCDSLTAIETTIWKQFPQADVRTIMYYSSTP